MNGRVVYLIVGEFLSLIDLSLKVIPLTLFLDVDPCSSANVVTTRVARCIFSCRLLSLLFCPREQNMRHRVACFQTAIRLSNRKRCNNRLTISFVKLTLFSFILSNQSRGVRRCECNLLEKLKKIQ